MGGAAAVILVCVNGLLCVRGLAATTSFNSHSQRAASSAGLQWGRPQVGSRSAAGSLTDTSTSAISQGARHRPLRVVRDDRVIAVGWQEIDRSAAPSVVEAQHTTIERPADAYDPFEEDDRLAQLVDDPFDEPAAESIPVPDPDSDTEEAMEGDLVDEIGEDIEVVEEALEEEIRRRQAGNDVFDEPSGGPLDGRSVEADPLEVPGPLEEFETEGMPEIDPLDDDTSIEEILESSQDDWQKPQLELQRDRDEERDYDDDELSPEELAERAKELAREQRESEAGCREELEAIEADLISSIDLSIRVDGNAGEDFPFECAVSTKRHKPRQWPQITYHWKAAALCHKPLYFEQVQLERYGHSWGPFVQPIMSGVHFFGTLPILPYKMGIRTPTECVYTLGYYRPGSCAPYMIDPIPFTWRAALLEGAAVTGISFIIP